MDKRCYLMALFPALLLALYLTTTSQSNFGSFWSAGEGTGSVRSQVMHAELGVLSMLKEQENGILELRTAAGSVAGMEEVGSGILAQLELNRKMQQMLKESLGDVASVSGGQSPVVGGAHCHKVGVGEAGERREVVWRPGKGRYLLALCVSGQFSNRLICVEKHMFFAALLNRSLVLPSKRYEVWAYDMSGALDVGHIKSCIGNRTVLTFDEFVAGRGRVNVDRFICYFRNCYLDEDKRAKLKAAGVTWSLWEDAWPSDPELGGSSVPSHPGLDDFLAKFGVEDEVIAIGDVFYADVEQSWQQQAGGPLAHPACKTIIQPSRLIVLTAQRFIQTYLGNNFLSFHFRRHGWLMFCNTNPEDCFFPIPQAAGCILRRLQGTNASVVFISSDAAPSEIDLLKAMLVEDGKPVPVITRPEHDSRVKWDSLLVKHKLDKSPEVMGMLDKTIHALATSFIGTAGSTFSNDIVRLRQEWGTASSCDEYLCQGEKPNYKAELN